ncbi:hypothetical protein Tco_0782954, partial [Tanacetum coccineum]
SDASTGADLDEVSGLNGVGSSSKWFQAVDRRWINGKSHKNMLIIHASLLLSFLVVHNDGPSFVGKIKKFDKDAEFILSPLLSDELQESNFLRNMDFLTEGNDNEFDAILAEMEKEMNIAEMLKELGYKCTSDTGLQDHKNAFLTFFSALCRRNLPDMPPGDEHS